MLRIISFNYYPPHNVFFIIIIHLMRKNKNYKILHNNNCKKIYQSTKSYLFTKIYIFLQRGSLGSFWGKSLLNALPLMGLMGGGGRAQYRPGQVYIGKSMCCHIGDGWLGIVNTCFRGRRAR